MTGVSSSTGFDPERIIRDHQSGVWRYLRSLGCDLPLAEDLTQETFLAVLQKPFDDYHPAATAAYLRRVARNLLMTYRRSSTIGSSTHSFAKHTSCEPAPATTLWPGWWIVIFSAKAKPPTPRKPRFTTNNATAWSRSRILCLSMARPSAPMVWSVR